MKQTTKFDKALLFIYALSLFFNNYCYLVWPTFNSVVSIAFKSIPYAITFFILIYFFVVKGKSFILSFSAVSMIVLGIVLTIHINYFGFLFSSTFSYGDFLNVFAIITLFLLNKEHRAIIINYFIKLFVVLCLPGLFYYLLNVIGIQLPYTVLSSGHDVKQYTVTYMHYPLGVVLRDLDTGIVRYCGIFDEPGFLGTVAGLLFAISFKRMNKGWSIILLVEGLFTFSFAFFAIIAIFFLLYYLLSNRKVFFVLLFSLVIVVLIVANTTFSSPILVSIQEKLSFSNSRMSNEFKMIFDSFVSQGGYPLYMGNGFEAANKMVKLATSFSFEMLIYDYGIIGTTLFLLFFTFGIIGGNHKLKSVIPFFVTFMASIYQRPYVFNIQFISLFICAIAFLDLKCEISSKKQFVTGKNTELVLDA